MATKTRMTAPDTDQQAGIGDASHDLEIVVAATIDRLGQVADALGTLADQCRWSDEHRFKVELIVEELLVNAMTHGQADTQEGWIRVRVSATGLETVIEITDNGKGFDPRDAAPPDLSLPLEERGAGGLGLHFVRELADEFDYRRVQDLNHVRVLRRHR